MLRRPVESAQYCSGLFQDTLKAYGMRSSMSRRGDCWDTQTVDRRQHFFCLLTEDRNRAVLHWGIGRFEWTTLDANRPGFFVWNFDDHFTLNCLRVLQCLLDATDRTSLYARFLKCR